MAVLLQASHVTMQFGGLKAVNDVDMEIQKGEVHALIGPNGAGKTTFFNIVSGIYTPTSGTVTFDGEDITKLKAHQVTARGIARTFQNILLFENMNIVRNVMVGAHTRTGSSMLGSVLRTRRSREAENATRMRFRHWNLLGWQIWQCSRHPDFRMAKSVSLKLRVR